MNKIKGVDYMSKRTLLHKFYGDEYETITLDELLTLSYFNSVEVLCIVKTPIYEFMITEDICNRLNKLYKNMTCRDLNVNSLTYEEIRDKFNRIQTQINFI
jgi:hypothetical protein